MDVKTKNKILAIGASMFRITAGICATGSLMQTFLSVLEFDASWIYLHSCLIQAANVCTILLCSRYGDGGKLIHRVTVVQIPIGLLFFGYLPLCIRHSSGPDAFVLLLTIGILQAVLMALSSVCDYKIPYYIYRAEDYGMVAAIGGILSAIAAFGIGTSMSILSMYYSYFDLMFWAFCISGVLYFASAVCLHFLKPIIDLDTIEKYKGNRETKISLINIFKEPVFYKLAFPNLMRGFANGVTMVLAVVASDDLGYGAQITTVMVSVTAAAGLLANGLFGWASRHFSPRYAVFAGSLSFIGLPFLLIPDQPILFLTFLFLIMLGRTFVDSGVPAVLIYVVPAKIAGPYHAYRMIMHTGGGLFAAAIASELSAGLLLPAAMILQLISGACYMFGKELKEAAPVKNK